MARTHNDTWDLASSVGATATMVATARAVASRAEDPLISDPFAEPLVRAVGVEVFTKLASGELTPEDFAPDAPDSTGPGMQRMTDSMAVRTKFFDDFFTAAADAGIRQAVILASGLDSRAYRLAWPAGMTVYEVDQPDVIAFKTRTLVSHGARPTADRRAVAVDLREDWPAALTAAGFTPAAPTAWSAEGLLGYLPADAQDRLLDTVTALSAPGSWLATESTPTPDPAERDEREAKVRERMAGAADQWRAHGLDLDLTELLYFGERNEAVGYLADHGWAMSGASIAELFAANGLDPLPDDDSGFTEVQYVQGVLG